MATKQQVRRALAKQGGTWDEAYETFNAPVGHNWEASGCHSIPHAWEDDLSAGENWAKLIDQISAGTVPCTLADCDICEEQQQPIRKEEHGR